MQRIKKKNLQYLNYKNQEAHIEITHDSICGKHKNQLSIFLYIGRNQVIG